MTARTVRQIEKLKRKEFQTFANHIKGNFENVVSEHMPLYKRIFA